MKLTVLLFLILIFCSTVNAREPYRTDSLGNIYVPSVEFTHTETGKKVLFVGFSHIDTPLFYSRASNYINSWVNKKSEKSIVLEEFFTCSSEVYDSDKKTFLDSEVDDFISLGIDFSPQSFVLERPRDLSKLLDLFSLKKRECVLDIDNKTMRPEYLVDRNRDGCNEAHEMGIGCQWSDFRIKDSKNLTIENGDLQIDQEDDEIQFVGFFMYRNLNYTEYMKKPIYKVYNSVRYVVLDYRNEVLVNKSLSALFERNFDNVILPWGVRHIYGVKDLLLGKGFTLTSIEDVLLNSVEEKIKMEEIGQGWEGVELSESYDFL